MAEDWDLYAVVRSCKSATNTATATAADAADDNSYPLNSSGVTSCAMEEEEEEEEEEEDPLACLASLKFEEENDDPFSFPNLVVESRNNAFQELQQFYKPFFSNPTTTTTTTTTTSTNLVVIPDSSISEFGGCTSGQQQKQQYHHHDNLLNTNANIRPLFSPGSYISQVKHAQAQPKQEQQIIQQEESRDHQGLIIQRPETTSLSIGQSQTQPPRSRKRKSQQKRMVCHVTAENLTSDLWAWRKYGQKPIKGSPYPRNYYRCSSSKGCAARKQVERSNSDPNMFIVTYTGEHTHPRPTHRNSLAGSTRTKFTANQKQTDKETDQSSTVAANNPPSCSSPLSGTSLSPTTPLTEQTDELETAKLQEEDNKLSKESEEIMEDENEDIEIEDDILIPNMAMSEDIFLGLQELGCSSSPATATATAADQIQSPPSSSDSFSDKGRGPPSLGSYWASTSSASAGATVSGGC